MALVASNNETPCADTQPNKRRRKKSVVWEHFTIETINADCTKAMCKQCKKLFAYVSGSKLAGTSHLKRHISLGICPVSRRNNQNNSLSPDTPTSSTDVSANVGVRARKRYRATPGFASIIYDQDRCNYDVAKMIIQHDYPLEMVENFGFISFAKALQPQFNVDITTIKQHILSIYLGEKQSLSDLLDRIPGRVSLTLDLRDSDQSVGYLFLTGHYIDCDWKLHKRILNVITLPCLDSEVAFSDAVEACLTDWNLDNRLFTLTLGHSIADDSVKGNLRCLLSIRNPLILNGQLIIRSCYARVLSHLAQDAIELFRVTVEKVRESVKYVKTSAAHGERFMALKQQLQVPSTKTLTFDDLAKWDTTYQMLVAASELKEVFSCLDTIDPDYVIILSMEEWRQVETLCAYLKLFFDAANIITAPVYPTANTFFHEVWKIQLELMHGTLSQDFLVSNLAKPLLEKFDIYWRECNLVLATAAVMDPRFKMKLVEFSFDRIYGPESESWIKVVDEGVHELFLEYVVQSLPPPTFIDEINEVGERTDTCQEDSFLFTADGLSDFDVYLSGIMNNHQLKSELDQYLEEPLLPRVQDFDVLGWWRNNSYKYPTLSKMASDILCIPVSTVAPESVFDIGNRKVDSYRSSLRPATLEALVCAKDWLQHESSSKPLSVIPTALIKMEY